MVHIPAWFLTDIVDIGVMLQRAYQPTVDVVSWHFISRVSFSFPKISEKWMRKGLILEFSCPNSTWFWNFAFLFHIQNFNCIKIPHLKVACHQLIAVNSAAACFFLWESCQWHNILFLKYFYLKIQFKKEGKVYILSSKSFPKTECFVFLGARVRYI